MQHSTMKFGHALSPVELSHQRYLDALIAFRPESCLGMTTGAPEGGSGDGGSGGQGGAGGQSGAPGVTFQPPANSGGQGDPQGGAQGGGNDGGSDKGFPADTPVKDMTLEQQVAYHQYHSQKHEGRNRELMAITGGKHGEDLRKEFDELGTLRKEKLTPPEKAIKEAEDAARAGVLPQIAETAFRIAIGNRKTETEVDEFIADLNLARFIKDGKVDTAKVLERVQQYAPDKDTGNVGQQRDFGQGNRGNGQSGKSGVAAGADMFATRRGSKPSTSS